jgi:hypothetical protein
MPPYQLGPVLSGIGTSGVLFVAAANEDPSSLMPGNGYIYSLNSFDMPYLGIEQAASGGVRVFWPLPATILCWNNLRRYAP